MAEDLMLSVIAPMYNESAGIEANIRNLIKKLQEIEEDWELILVNDGSTDNTLEIVRQNFSQDNRVQIISYKQNRGRGYALRKGFEQAMGKYIVTTESDLSWGPEIIKKLFDELKTKELDMVIASPYLHGGRLENVPFKRAFLSRYGNKILSLAAHSPLSMLSGMTRGYRGEVIKSIDLKSDGKEIHLEIVSKVNILGYRIGEIPAILRWEKPEKGKSKRKSSFPAGKLIMSHLLFSFDEKPFLFLGGIGFLFTMIGIIIGFYALYLSFYVHPVGGRPVVFGSVLFIIFGLQVIVFAFLANQNRELRRNLTRIEEKILKILSKHGEKK